MHLYSSKCMQPLSGIDKPFHILEAKIAVSLTHLVVCKGKACLLNWYMAYSSMVLVDALSFNNAVNQSLERKDSRSASWARS